MIRADNAIVFQLSFGERPAKVRTRFSDSKDMAAAPHKQNRRLLIHRPGWFAFRQSLIGQNSSKRLRERLAARTIYPNSVLVDHLAAEAGGIGHDGIAEDAKHTAGSARSV